MDGEDVLLKKVIPSTLKANTLCSLCPLGSQTLTARRDVEQIFHGKYFFAKKKDIKILTEAILY